MGLDFPSLNEQMQLSLIIGSRVLADDLRRPISPLEGAIDRNGVPLELRLWIVQKLFGEKSLRDEERAAYEEPKNKVLFDEIIEAMRAQEAAKDHYSEIKAHAKKSRFSSVVGQAWADADEAIREIQHHWPNREALHNALYALSIASMATHAANNVPENVWGSQGGYRVHDPDIYSVVNRATCREKGYLGSVLNERGQEMLERLNILNGASAWEKAEKVRPEALAFASS